MNLKNLTLATTLVLAIPGLSLVACKKTPNKVTVKITATDANTARTWEKDSLKKKGTATLKNWGFDSLVSKAKDNANSAEVIEAKISYTDQKGKPVTKELGKDGLTAQSFASGVDVADAKIGTEITVTAKAKSNATTVATENFADLATGKNADAVAKAIQENLKKDPNLKAFKDNLDGLNDKAAEQPTVTLTIDVNGQKTTATNQTDNKQPAQGEAKSAKVDQAK